MKLYTVDDAVTALQAIVRAEDWDRLEQACEDVDRLDQPPPTPTLGAAALWYAEHGIPVFPLAVHSKVPRSCSRGLLDATTDLEQVRNWWKATPYANIGLATGHRFDVWDIDGPIGQAHRAGELWEPIFAAVEDICYGKVLTPSPGAMHMYIPVTGRKNSTDHERRIDYRGLGGYVVAPPSITPAGIYRWLGTLSLPEQS